MSSDGPTVVRGYRIDPVILSGLRELAAREQRTVNNMLNVILGRALGLHPTPARESVDPSADVARDPHTTRFPVVAVAPAGAGRDALLVDTGETVEVPNSLAREVERNHYQFVRVVGDSMEPTFYDGDIVTVRPVSLEKVRSGSVVYCRLNGDPQIKELRISKDRKRLTLMPRNFRRHDPIPILSDDVLEVVALVCELAHRRDAANKG